MSTPPDPSPPPKPVSRRRFLRNLAGLAAVPLVGGIYAWQVEPYWVDYHDVPLSVPNLPASFEGFRIAHLTDLHASADTPASYLRSVVQVVNRSRPDLVCITGDLLTHGMEWVKPVADLVASIESPVFISFGNHDYDVESDRGTSNMRLAEAMTRSLGALPRCTLLRNAAIPIERGDERLWIVGLEDLWSGMFSPETAFKDVPPASRGSGRAEPVICLSHNPDSAPKLDSWAPQLILCGHTHGGQIRIPLLGAPLLPIANRRFEQGLFQLPNSQLYVSRGVGYLSIVPRVGLRFCCRPEVPTLVLHRA